MANNYTQFSTQLSLPNWEAQQYAIDLATRLQEQNDDSLDDLPESMKEEAEFWSCCVVPDGSDSPGIVCYSEESGNVELLALYLQHLIQKFLPAEHAEFAWACWCSKPRIDEFGGGACFITADCIEWYNTGQWIQDQCNEWNANENACPIPKD